MAEQILTNLLQHPSVRIQDPLTVQKKLNKIINAGIQKLFVISDFDHTLTKHCKNGNRCPTTHGIFELVENPERYGYTEESKTNLVDTRDKFLLIEFCPLMSVEEKIPYMIEWWNDTHNKIIQWKITEDNLEKITLDSKIELRDEVVDFTQKLNNFKIPLIVFSAGIGNIINVILKKHMGELPKTVHVVSNMMEFDEKTKQCVSFSTPIIHTFNKNSTVIQKDSTFLNNLADRTSVILLGDSLGDIHMDVGIEKEGVVLKIGFLNFNVETLSEKYLYEYDIVLIDDSTFRVPMTILNGIYNAVTSNNNDCNKIFDKIEFDSVKNRLILCTETIDKN